MKTRRNKHRSSNQKGGGGILEFLWSKPGEIPAQARLFFRSWEKGHSLTTIPSIGNWIHQYGTSPKTKLVPLDSIILWHPVRGASEREDAGAKTTRRANSMIQYLRYTLGKLLRERKPVEIHLTENIFAGIPDMKSSDFISAIQVTPFLSGTRRYIKKKLSKRKHTHRTQKATINLGRSILSRLPEFEAEVGEDGKGISLIHTPPRGIPVYSSSDPFYIVSSGQGRLQAIKEAVSLLKIDPSRVFIETMVYDVPRNLCNLFLIVGNEFREDGFFDDPRHRSDRIWLPNAMSCNKNAIQTSNILSILDEMTYEDKDKSKFFNQAPIQPNILPAETLPVETKKSSRPFLSRFGRFGGIFGYRLENNEINNTQLRPRTMLSPSTKQVPLSRIENQENNEENNNETNNEANNNEANNEANNVPY